MLDLLFKMKEIDAGTNYRVMGSSDKCLKDGQSKLNRHLNGLNCKSVVIKEGRE